MIIAGNVVLPVPEIVFVAPLNVTEPMLALKEPPLLIQFPYTSRL